MSEYKLQRVPGGWNILKGDAVLWPEPNEDTATVIFSLLTDETQPLLKQIASLEQYVEDYQQHESKNNDQYADALLKIQKLETENTRMRSALTQIIINASGCRVEPSIEHPEYGFWLSGKVARQGLQSTAPKAKNDNAETEIIGKPCALILEKGKGENWQQRILIFDDHIQAMDIAEHFKKAGWAWSLRSFEHVTRSEKPSDMPIVQMDLFGKSPEPENEDVTIDNDQIEWFANHQNPDGSFRTEAGTGAFGLHHIAEYRGSETLVLLPKYATKANLEAIAAWRKMLGLEP